jgi:hypothetical protein
MKRSGIRGALGVCETVPDLIALHSGYKILPFITCIRFRQGGESIYRQYDFSGYTALFDNAVCFARLLQRQRI